MGTRRRQNKKAYSTSGIYKLFLHKKPSKIFMRGIKNIEWQKPWLRDENGARCVILIEAGDEKTPTHRRSRKK